MPSCRTLAIVLGDQLDRDSNLIRSLDPAQDIVWMAEVGRESTHVPSHKVRIALFLSAMRHFRDELRARGLQVHYRTLDETMAAARDADRSRSKQNPVSTFSDELARAAAELRPQRLAMVEPGDYRVLRELQTAAADARLPLHVLPDTHFLCSLDEFRAYASGRKQLRLEYFYRDMRRKTGVLMERDGQPAGGAWNYDAQNRGSFPASGPKGVPPRKGFAPDAVTREVLDTVERHFASHPGKLAHFDWPVTPAQARQALEDFLATRLARFGEFQDAMWADQPWLYHAHISSSLNLKLLDPRAVIAAAERHYQEGRAPLAAVEGFIRQILGWREYVRGIYWTFMPGYAEGNALDAHVPLPDFYWTGDTPAECLRQVIRQTLEYGYAHHIQRLMVTGLYALLLGVQPRQVHEWYLSVYVDAVEWVELPNTLGMSQFADGGLMASKPYAATGKYIQRMSNYCRNCPFDPAEAVGDRACPFTTLYWDFLLRNESRLRRVGRMDLQLKNLAWLSEQRKRTIRQQASRIQKGELVKIGATLA